MEQFSTEDALPVMITDSKVSSHPIIVNVQNPNQINEVFDRISYSKVGIRVEIISKKEYEIVMKMLNSNPYNICYE